MLDQQLLPRMRDDTIRFIAVNPIELVLLPRTRIDDGTGGKRLVSGSPRVPQVFTLLEPDGSNYKMKETYTEGTNTTYVYMLLGAYDAALDLYDEFTMNGTVYRVENILPYNGYERRAIVVAAGA